MELNYLWATICIPVIMGFFKSEISTFIGDLMIYRNRAFDNDGDPGTSQDCFIQSGATGEFNRITVAEYRFGLAPSKRKVITYQADPNGDKDKYIVVPFSYAAWAGIVKGSLQIEKK